MDSLIELVWRELFQAVVSPGHPWRTPVLVTGGPQPDGRVVVLRRFERDPDRLTCFTDIRSPKIAAVRADSRVTWVFYHPEHRLQLRVRGTATVHQEETWVRTDWESLTEAGRREYAVAAPPGSCGVSARELRPDEAAGHFAVLVTVAAEWDCLQLAAGGHRRVRFTARGLESVVP